MAMPTDEELKTALSEAARMREQGEDAHHLAKALLNLNYKVRILEKVLESAESFYRSGQSLTAEQHLKKAMDEARTALNRSGGIERTRLGLG